ncbi:MAG: hypothetical protein JSS49_21920 [Planctomycetes bacterium]|nr:hypothetical protein [Planctomycetota bacterium]
MHSTMPVPTVDTSSTDRFPRTRNHKFDDLTTGRRRHVARHESLRVRTASIQPPRGAAIPRAVAIPSSHQTAARIECGLEESGYPLQNVRCRCDEQTVVLIGQTTRYYYVQVALTLAMSLAGRIRVVSEIQVLSKSSET